jgi:hypothetical protein
MNGLNDIKGVGCGAREHRFSAIERQPAVPGFAKLRRRFAEGAGQEKPMHQHYRHFDANDRLLYVGESYNAPARLSQHKRDASWYRDIVRVTIETYATKAEAKAAQTAAIRAEDPVYNMKENVVWT